MGNGMVLEHGTHNELLSNEDGPYARLVSAQKLRQTNPADDENNTPDASQADLMTKAEVQEAVKEEVPLGRTTTGSGRSLASEALEKKRADGFGKFGAKEYHMAYLFKRMGRINRSDLNLYIGGAIFAISKPSHPIFLMIY